MGNYVLEPLSLDELNKYFDETSIKVIEFFMKRSLFAQPEALPGQPHLPIQVPKEHIEQWVVQAIGGIPSGAGSYPVDVLKPGDFGADVKMLSCSIYPSGELKDADSGETSLAQKFSSTGNELDQLFAEHKYNEIVVGWTDILKNKLQHVINNDGVSKILYFFILRAGSMFYLCGLRVYVERINDISVLRTTSSSVFVDNFIDSRYGNVKIYKAKKRLELRLRPKFWVNNGLVIPFKLENKSQPANLRDIVLKDKLNEYQEDILKRIF